MSIQGPASQPFRPFAPAASAPARPPHAHGAHAGHHATKSADAQAPKDSSLWDVLTDEERDFFSQQASMGALTYGRARAAAPAATTAAPIGQRLDVRG
jgi:hypothetical protein